MIEDVEKLLQYVCYERTYQYFMKKYLKINSGDLLYYDRMLGFNFDENDAEPIIPHANELQLFLEENFIINDTVTLEGLLNRLSQASNQELAKVGMSMKNAQGEDYYTSVLLESASEHEVFFTKINEVETINNQPISLENFKKRVYLNKQNKIDVEFLQYDGKSYEKKVGNIMKTGLVKYCATEYAQGFREYIEDQRRKLDEENALLQMGENKNLQLRFSKHVLNKLYPIVFFLQTIQSNEELIILSQKIIKSLEDLEKVAAIILSLQKATYIPMYLTILEDIDTELKEAYRLMKNYGGCKIE